MIVMTMLASICARVSPGSAVIYAACVGQHESAPEGSHRSPTWDLHRALVSPYGSPPRPQLGDRHARGPQRGSWTSVNSGTDSRDLRSRSRILAHRTRHRGDVAAPVHRVGCRRPIGGHASP